MKSCLLASLGDRTKVTVERPGAEGPGTQNDKGLDSLDSCDCSTRSSITCSLDFLGWFVLSSKIAIEKAEPQRLDTLGSSLLETGHTNQSLRNNVF